MDFSNQLFRCSSLGHIMTEPRGKSNLDKYNEACERFSEKKQKLLSAKPGTKTYEKLILDIEKLTATKKELALVKDEPNLSDTCITHLADIRTSVKYSVTEKITSKYMEKGNACEEDGITLLSLKLGMMLTKNSERKFNNWIEGECDIDRPDDKISDIKNSWSAYTFGRTLVRGITIENEWQMKGYLWLWEKKEGTVAYTLVNTPKHLVEREKNSLMYDMFGSRINYETADEATRKIYAEACEEIDRNNNYDHIPESERVMEFPVRLLDGDIERMMKRVEDCRIFLNHIESGRFFEERYITQNGVQEINTEEIN